MKRVLLAGEGSNELGDWASEHPYQPAQGKRRRGEPAPREGVLEALLRQVHPDGWEVGGGVLWKNIRKLRAGQHRGAEARNVLGLLNKAAEDGFDTVAFSRDRDGDQERGDDLTRGLREAQEVIARCPEYIGGLAVERLESWVAAVLGIPGSEEKRDLELDRLLERQGIHAKDGRAMVEAIRRCGLGKIPDDAGSLRDWIDQARKTLGDAP